MSKSEILDALMERKFRQQDRYHLSLVRDAAITYCDGKADTSRCQAAIDASIALAKAGDEYYARGYRLRKSGRQVWGLGWTVPDGAIEASVEDAGHIATSPAERLYYVVKT